MALSWSGTSKHFSAHIASSVIKDLFTVLLLVPTARQLYQDLLTRPLEFGLTQLRVTLSLLRAIQHLSRLWRFLMMAHF
jgi:hypothetical protein